MLSLQVFVLQWSTRVSILISLDFYIDPSFHSRGVNFSEIQTYSCKVITLQASHFLIINYLFFRLIKYLPQLNMFRIKKIDTCIFTVHHLLCTANCCRENGTSSIRASCKIGQLNEISFSFTPSLMQLKNVHSFSLIASKSHHFLHVSAILGHLRVIVHFFETVALH
jgi:hypothetical protein